MQDTDNRTTDITNLGFKGPIKYTKMPYATFQDNPNRISHMISSGLFYLHVRYNDYQPVYEVKLPKRVINKIISNAFMDKMADYLQEKKPLIRVLWHDEKQAGRDPVENSTDLYEYRDDYLTVTRDGAMFYFNKADGTRYCNDLQWELWLSCMSDRVGFHKFK